MRPAPQEQQGSGALTLARMARWTTGCRSPAWRARTAAAASAAPSRIPRTRGKRRRRLPAALPGGCSRRAAYSSIGAARPLPRPMCTRACATTWRSCAASWPTPPSSPFPGAPWVGRPRTRAGGRSRPTSWPTQRGRTASGPGRTPGRRSAGPARAPRRRRSCSGPARCTSWAVGAGCALISSWTTALASGVWTWPARDACRGGLDSHRCVQQVLLK
mmetsp:Transcript_52277/g.158443  ORF Transcript_52277/g.158443 Transcript_52277/m.158443 type:complete len:217 (+) Transcript_52277:630-1280(+)